MTFAGSKELKSMISPDYIFHQKREFYYHTNSTCLNFQVHIAREHINILLSHAVIDFNQSITEIVLIVLDIFLMSTLQFTTFSKLFKKADCAVRALTVLPTISDLAEA